MSRLCAIAVAAIAAVGCADNGDEALLILQNQFPLEECVISGEEDSVVQDDGTLDVLGGSGYLLTPLVKNTAVGESGTEAQRRIFIKGARVDVSFPGTDAFSDDELQQYREAGLTRFQVPLAGSISPDGGTLALSFDIIQSALTAVLTDKLANGGELLAIATVVVRGELGGGTVESQKFDFPVRICAGCLVASVGTCDEFRDSGAEALPGNPCNPFQDSPVDCCTQNGLNLCPAR